MSHAGEFDYVIIGAGPAGLQLAYYLEKSGKNYIVLEGAEGPGNSFSIYPRHRTLISINKVYTGYDDREVNYRHDWNSLLSDDDDLLFKKYTKEYFPSADTYVDYLYDFTEKNNINVCYKTRVKEISKDGEFAGSKFAIDTVNGEQFIADKLIVCTGVSKPFLPDVKGIELTENYDSVSVDPEDFTGQTVLIIGKGNSGFETADNLVAHSSTIHIVSPTPLNLAWKTHFVGHLRAVNNNFLDSYQLKSQNAVLDAQIDSIRKDESGKYHVTLNYVQAEEQEVLVYDRVICCAGFRFDNTIFADECKPELTINNRFPHLTNEWESKNIEGLYFAGTITQSLDYKKSTSGFVHGFRYSAKSLYHVLERKYHGQSLSIELGQLSVQEITDYLITRINKTSALWQQYGFLSDVMLLDRNTGNASYVEEINVGYVKEKTVNEYQDVLMLTMEYGPKQEDPFNAKRVNPEDVDNAHQSSFLHPIIRYFKEGELVSEHHIIENLAGEWFKDEHVLPLLHYLSQQVGNSFTEKSKMSA